MIWYTSMLKGDHKPLSETITSMQAPLGYVNRKVSNIHATRSRKTLIGNKMGQNLLDSKSWIWALLQGAWHLARDQRAASEVLSRRGSRAWEERKLGLFTGGRQAGGI